MYVAETQTGGIDIGKVVTAVLAALLIVLLITDAQAVMPDEMESQIESCRLVKDTAHQMAECARQLGFSEDHPAIQSAQEKWREADAQEQELRRQLSDMLDMSSRYDIGWTGPKLTKQNGVNYGPSGKETYYNLPMGGVVRIMRNMGFSEAEYPYWVREDGVKMLGDYVIAAGNLKHWPRGSVVPSSLGDTLICDTGYLGWNQLDIAVVW